MVVPPWILCGFCLDLDQSGFGWIHLGLDGFIWIWMDPPGFGCCVDPVWVGPEWVLSGPYMLSAICYEWVLYAKCYMLVLCASAMCYEWALYASAMC